MMLSVDDDINRMSQDIYNCFFQSLEGGKSLDSFLTTWSDFEYLVGSHQDELKPATLQMVRNLADGVGTVASSFLQLGDVASQIVRDTEDEVTRIFGELLIENAVGESTDSRDDLSPSSLPSYVKACYRWLMENLHNPYPPKAIRQTIAKEAHSSVRDIENWFADVRKRVGWNDLRKRFFANRKDLIVKAATQFFKPPSGPVDVELLRYDSCFASLLASAKNLYSGELLADSPFKSRTNRRVTSSSTATEAAALEYPSPTPSPNSSTTSLPPLVTVSARKRRLSEDTLHSESEFDKPHRKLARSSIPMEQAIASLPSPAPSSLDLDRSDISFVEEIKTTYLTSEKSTGKRKRCASDSYSDGQPNTKRVHTTNHHDRHISPCTIIESPHLELIQTVMSNPATFSDGPVAVEPIDDNSNFEISIFEYDFGPRHCIADDLTNVVGNSSEFVHPGSALPTDFDLSFGNFQGSDPYTFNLDLDTPAAPDIFQPFVPYQSSFEWVYFNPGYNLHCPDTLGTSILTDCNFS